MNDTKMKNEVNVLAVVAILDFDSSVYLCVCYSSEFYDIVGLDWPVCALWSVHVSMAADLS